MMYSVERPYENPIILTPNCTSGDSADTIKFETFNNFKTVSEVSGTYIVETTTGEEVASGTMTWKAHWRSTEMSIETSPGACVDECIVTLTNVAGDAGQNTVICG